MTDNRNQTDNRKQTETAILVVSFGTSYNENRELTIGAIEERIAQEFPKYEVRRAFTSGRIRRKLLERDGLHIDSVEEALERAAADGIKCLAVQPTHMMDGFEYMKLAETVENYRDCFESLSLGEPLLSSEEDFRAIMEAIVGAAECGRGDFADAGADSQNRQRFDSVAADSEAAFCFMGHGTEAAANRIYSRLQKLLFESGHENYYIGTVEGEPDFEELQGMVNEKGCYRRIVMQPLMVVSGDHANNDMAGEEEDSWKSRFEAAGYETVCILEGLGQNPAVRELYAAHTRAAVEKLFSAES